MKRLHHLFSITPGATLTPTKGPRTAGAFVLAVLVLAAFGHTPFGSAVGLGFLLGVLFTSFCDVGASVCGRIMAMSVLTLGGPLVVAAGRSPVAPWWVAALAVFLVTLFAGFLSLYGPLMSLVGVLLTMVFVVTLGMDGGPGTALPSAFGFLLGGAVALLGVSPIQLRVFSVLVGSAIALLVTFLDQWLSTCQPARSISLPKGPGAA